MIRRPPRSTLSSSSAASDVYKRQGVYWGRCYNVLGREMITMTIMEIIIVRRVTKTLQTMPILVVVVVVNLSLDGIIIQVQWSVSYTHLRAHETPEHLVCRLLLEKKKEYINSED
eukprot:TRINITY_DN31044_c0_g1_i1.p1 TRINITY_DN31044_c0_g1~~TRINITY_DN31044_c0_g1_i1.p1  ORF type:complete len:115 (+),score=13.47 TRINITY_DN31044_c0_g1_i1:133-477(+)